AALAPQPQATWYRLAFSKLAEARWLSHLELVNALYRSLRRSGLPLAFSAGHHPLPRVAFHGALPVGVESRCETLDVALAAEISPNEVVSRLNRVLPAGLEVLSAAGLPQDRKPPRVDQTVYQVQSPAPVFDAAAAADFLERREFPVTRRRPKKGDQTVDVRSLVAALEVLEAHSLEMRVITAQKANLKAAEILRHIFALTESQIQDLHIVKKQVI
ncbi:MAG: TIGR03936 family radical SAM-associated protein, partial [Thermodesulfobacteriota bacterium]